MISMKTVMSWKAPRFTHVPWKSRRYSNILQEVNSLLPPTHGGRTQPEREKLKIYYFILSIRSLSNNADITKTANLYL